MAHRTNCFAGWLFTSSLSFTQRTGYCPVRPQSSTIEIKRGFTLSSSIRQALSITTDASQISDSVLVCSLGFPLPLQFFLESSHVNICKRMQPLIAIPATIALVYRAWSRKSLTPAGIVVAALTAIIHAIHPWSICFFLLGVFFISGTAVTKVRTTVSSLKGLR